MMTSLLRGGEYNFKHQPERLKYIGKHKGWHQFERVGVQGVWCELLDSDLPMIEETKDNSGGMNWERISVDDDLDWEMWRVSVKSTRFGECKLTVWADSGEIFKCSAIGSDGIEQTSGDLKTGDMEEAKRTALVWVALAR